MTLRDAMKHLSERMHDQYKGIDFRLAPALLKSPCSGNFDHKEMV